MTPDVPIGATVALVLGAALGVALVIACEEPARRTRRAALIAALGAALVATAIAGIVVPRLGGASALVPIALGASCGEMGEWWRRAPWDFLAAYAISMLTAIVLLVTLRRLRLGRRELAAVGV